MGGDISVLLDEESQRKIEQDTTVDQTDPFAQFADESPGAGDEGDGNLGFLQDDEEDESEATGEAQHSPQRTDGGRGE